jgi:hypothetical protein
VNGYDDPNTLDDRGFEETLKQGRRIYFSDVGLLSAAVLDNFGFEAILCKERSLERDVNRFENHIFLFVFNYMNEINGISKTPVSWNFQEALAGKGYRCVVLGTGKYAKVRTDVRDAVRAELTMRKGEQIKDFRLPFDLSMVSSRDSARIALNGDPFFCEKVRPGLWMLVFDPALGIVVDEFIYGSVKPQMSACLYRTHGSLKNHARVKSLKPMDLSITGGNPPVLDVQGGVLDIHFTGKNSFVGHRLPERLTGMGIVAMEVAKRNGGMVRAGLQTNAPSKFCNLSPSYSIVDSEDWQAVTIPFHVVDNVDPGPEGWGFVGLWGDDAETSIRIRNVKLIKIGAKREIELAGVP